MKSSFLVFFGCALAFASAELLCTHKELDIPKEWVEMASPCVQKMRNQVEEELKAAMQYMAMGAYFSQDTVNLPGFAEFFFKAASEEREHAINFISYLLMRGELTTKVSSLIKRNLSPKTTSWTNGVSALKDALKLETYVTRKIRDIIKVCESGSKYNDYNVVDHLSGDILEEQYRGERDIAGKISVLEKMMADHGALGEWMFDKKLTNGGK